MDAKKACTPDAASQVAFRRWCRALAERGDVASDANIYETMGEIGRRIWGFIGGEPCQKTSGLSEIDPSSPLPPTVTTSRAPDSSSTTSNSVPRKICGKCSVLKARDGTLYTSIQTHMYLAKI